MNCQRCTGPYRNEIPGFWDKGKIIKKKRIIRSPGITCESPWLLQNDGGKKYNRRKRRMLDVVDKWSGRYHELAWLRLFVYMVAQPFPLRNLRSLGRARATPVKADASLDVGSECHASREMPVGPSLAWHKNSLAFAFAVTAPFFHPANASIAYSPPFCCGCITVSLSDSFYHLWQGAV